MTEIAWRWNRLSPTESRVAELLLDGRSNKDICCEVFLSRARVQECIRRIVVKTGADSTRGAITLLAEERETAALVRLLEQANDAVAILQDGMVKWANTALARLSGYAPSELRGMLFSDLLLPEARERVTKRYEERLEGRRLPSTYKVTLLCKGGREKDVRVAYSGMIRYDGKPAVLGAAFEKE